MAMRTPTALDETFISSDAGNGWAACYRLVNGKIKQHGIPHARARVTGARLNADLGSQNIAEYADFLGQRYGYGDQIWNLTDAPIDLHQNTARRYGGHMHLFLMLVNVASMNVKSGSDLTLIVPAPPGLLNEVGPQIKKAILAGESGHGDGIWSIQLRRDRTPREYRFIRVITVPEGAGAFAAYRFDRAGELVPLEDKSGADVLAGRIAVLDLGAGTGDTYSIFDGNLNPDAIAHATDDRAGVIHNLLKPILADVLQAVPNATHLTTAHIDSYLRRYVQTPTPESATIRVSGKSVNIEVEHSRQLRALRRVGRRQQARPAVERRDGHDCRSGRRLAVHRELDSGVVSGPAAAQSEYVPAHQEHRALRPERGGAAPLCRGGAQDAAGVR